MCVFVQIDATVYLCDDDGAAAADAVNKSSLSGQVKSDAIHISYEQKYDEKSRFLFFCCCCYVYPIQSRKLPFCLSVVFFPEYTNIFMCVCMWASGRIYLYLPFGILFMFFSPSISFFPLCVRACVCLWDELSIRFQFLKWFHNIPILFFNRLFFGLSLPLSITKDIGVYVVFYLNRYFYFILFYFFPSYIATHFLFCFGFAVQFYLSISFLLFPNSLAHLLARSYAVLLNF